MVKTLTIAAVTLVVGLVLGFFLGRFTLEQQYKSPFVTLTPEAEQRSAQGDADPTPKAGTRVMRPLPLGRARLATRELTSADPLVVTVGSVGRGDEGAELHLVVENRAPCTVRELSGVAYAYDAWGAPVKANVGGEHYVAFAASGQKLAPGESTAVVQKARHPDTASLLVAHVDRMVCDGGKTWARP